jgi:transposase-like protein
MGRLCTSCQHLRRAEIDHRLAAGEPTAQVARDYDINPSSLHRHRANCLKLGSANSIKKEAARGTVAVALLPSKETLSGAFSDLASRIDEIIAQAQAGGSLKVALSGLNSLRQTLEAHARLAGHIGAPSSQVNIAIQNNVNVNAIQVAERLIEKFDREPDMKARIADALLQIEHEQNAECVAVERIEQQPEENANSSTVNIVGSVP